MQKLSFKGNVSFLFVFVPIVHHQLLNCTYQATNSWKLIIDENRFSEQWGFFQNLSQIVTRPTRWRRMRRCSLSTNLNNSMKQNEIGLGNKIEFLYIQFDSTQKLIVIGSTQPTSRQPDHENRGWFKERRKYEILNFTIHKV